MNVYIARLDKNSMLEMRAFYLLPPVWVNCLLMVNEPGQLRLSSLHGSINDHLVNAYEGKAGMV